LDELRTRLRSYQHVLWLWLAIDPCTKVIPVLHLGPRTQNMAHMVIHSLRQILAPGYLPLFTSDGLNLYFYALTAHFGQWLALDRRGRKARQWQVAAGLIYGQVKKSYRRRKLARITHVMRLGTQADLTVALQGMGFSGRLNTATISRVNLTVRHGISALARRTWATAKLAPQLLAHLEWWRTSYHFVRPHAALRLALVQPAAARWQVGSATLPTAYGSSGSRENEPTMDGVRGALLPIAAGPRLRAPEASCGGSVMSWGGR
jgi:IS1 family transposase